MNRELPFIFGKEQSSNNVTARVGVPANIFKKQTLLDLIAEELRFPCYFGDNWDAFEECLRDLSWLPAGQVILDHADIPLISDVASARIYVVLLAEAIRKTSRSDHPLNITFPMEFADRLSWLLRLSGD